MPTICEISSGHGFWKSVESEAGGVDVRVRIVIFVHDFYFKYTVHTKSRRHRNSENSRKSSQENSFER